jgi:hypothetical protein
LRNIDVREFSMEFLGSHIPRSCGLFCRGEVPQVKILPSGICYGSKSHLSSRVDAYESARIIFSTLPIAAILLGIRGAEIVASVVERVSVSMVPLSVISRIEAENISMHSLRLLVAFLVRHEPKSIKAFRMFIELRTPLPLHEPVVISGIDQSKLALREGYCAVG